MKRVEKGEREANSLLADPYVSSMKMAAARRHVEGEMSQPLKIRNDKSITYWKRRERSK